jgi:diacylglycerol kinase family enzyme
MSEPDDDPVHLVVNLASGAGEGARVAEIASELCRAAGRKLVLHAPDRPSALGRMAESARTAASRQGGVVVAAGGDGTVRTVARLLAGSEIPMAVVPVGTFNFFARNHAISEDPEAALRVAMEGTPQSVTLGEVNGEIFLINASFGLYAKAIRDRETSTDRFGRNRLVAILSTVATLLAGRRPLRLEIEVDGQAQEVRTPTVFVGNNALQLRHLSLNVAQCMKQARLAIVVMRPVGTWEMFRLTVRGLLRRLEEEESLRTFCADTLVVRNRRLPMAVALDGELLRIKPPLHFRSWPGAINLMVPRTSADAEVAA